MVIDDGAAFGTSMLARLRAQTGTEAAPREAPRAGAAPASGADMLRRAREYEATRKTAGTAIREVFDRPAQALPYLAGLSDAVIAARVWRLGRAVEAGETLEAEDREFLVGFLQDAQRPQSIGYMATKLVAQLPAFMGEFLTSAGAAAAGRAGAQAGARRLLGKGMREQLEKILATETLRDAALAQGRDKLATKLATRLAATSAGARATAAVTGGVGAVAGRVAQFGAVDALLGGGRISANAYQRAMPGLALEEDEAGQLGVAVYAGGRDFLDALPEAVLDQFIEVGSEMSGGVLAKLPLLDRARTAAAKVAESWIARHNPVGSKVGAFLKVLDRAGWQGPIEEYLEERVGDTARAVTGLGEFEDIWPGLEQSAAELLAFSVPGAVVAGAEFTRGKIDAGRPAAKPKGQRFAEAAAAAKEPGRVSDEEVERGIAAWARASRVTGARQVKREELGEDEAEARDALDLGRMLGVDVRLVEGEGQADSRGAMLGSGFVLVRRRTPDATAVVWHEVSHQTRRRSPEDWDAMRAQVDEAAPGFLAAADAYWRKAYGASVGKGKAVEADLAAEESLATATEWLAPVLSYGVTEAGRADLERVLEAQPSFLRRVKEAVLDVVAKLVGATGQNTRRGAEARLRDVLADAGEAGDLGIEKAARAALAILDTVQGVEARRAPGSRMGFEAQGPAQPAARTAAAPQAPTPGAGGAPAQEAGEGVSQGEAPVAAGNQRSALPARVEPESRPARTKAERQAEREARKAERKAANTPLPGDTVEYTKASPSGATIKVTGTVLDVTGSGMQTAWRVRINEDVARAGEGRRAASENRARRAENEVVVTERGRLRLLAPASDLDPTSKTAKRRAEAEARLRPTALPVAVPSPAPLAQPMPQASVVLKPEPTSAKPAPAVAGVAAISKALSSLARLQSHYQGNKREHLKINADAMARAIAPVADQIEVVADLYAGGATYGSSISASTILPNQRLLIVNEVDPIRNARLRFSIEEGASFLDEWDTQPVLKRLRAELQALRDQYISNTPAGDAMKAAAGDEDYANNAFAKYATEVRALPVRARAAVMAVIDVMAGNIKGRLARSWENARTDADRVRAHFSGVRARGVTVEITQMDAFDPALARLVASRGRSLTLADPPYFMAAAGSYSGPDGKKIDFKSAEVLHASIEALKPLADSSVIVYHNKDTAGHEARAAVLARLPGSQVVLWRRQRRGRAQQVGEVLGIYDGISKSRAAKGGVGPVRGDARDRGGPGRGSVLERTGGDAGGRADAAAERSAGGDGGAAVSPDEGLRFAAAYHGSPHTFDRFDMSKIGTGEGAQAFGHGLYFAGKREVAEYYRRVLGGVRYTIGDGAPVDWATLYGNVPAAWKAVLSRIEASLPNGGFTQELQRERERYEAYGVDPAADSWINAELRTIKAIQNTVKEVPKGRLYQVNLAPAEDEYLLWDEPLSAQPEKVQRALRTMWTNKGGNPNAAAPWTAHSRNTGESIYAAIGVSYGGNDNNSALQKAASSALLAAGIRGIKYLDGSSRGKGEGAYNYVIFDDADVKIEARFAPSLPPTLTISGVERPTTNSEGRPLASDEDGVRAFWRWFGDSKVVDGEGRPRPMYHATAFGDAVRAYKGGVLSPTTREPFTKFKPGGSNARMSGRAVWFSPDPGKTMAAHNVRPGDEGENVFQVYLRVERPAYTRPPGARGEFAGMRPGIFIQTITDEDIRALLADRYDGVIEIADGGAVTEAAVFFGEQIKSAIGNAGTFDPAKTDIRFAAALPPATRAKVRAAGLATRQMFQDRTIRLRALMDEHGIETGSAEDADLHGALDLAISKAGAAMDALTARILKALAPFRGKDLAEIQRAVAAHSAPQRNAWMLAERGVKDASGISDGLAAQIEAAARGKLGSARVDKLLAEIEAINREHLDLMVQSQVLTREAADKWHAREPHYLSLRDMAEELEGELKGFQPAGRSAAVRGPLFRKAEGRVELAGDALLAWHTSKLAQTDAAFRNRALAEQGVALAAEFDGRDDAPVRLVRKGEHRGPKEPEGGVAFFLNGERAWLVFADQNIADALKGLDAKQVGWALGALAKVTRTFSRGVTSRNPFFWPRNFLRDTMGAAFNVAAGEGRTVGEAARVVAAAWRDLPHLIRHAAGKTSRMSARIERAQRAGYKTTWAQRDAKDLQVAMQDALAEARTPMQRARAFFRGLDRMSDAFEQATRLAAFEYELERTGSETRAALYAKRLTVNFDMRGDATTALSAVFAFFNPAVQGATRMLEAVSSPKGVKLAAGLVGMGLLVEVLGFALSDDDEATGLPEYAGVSEFERSRSLVSPVKIGGVYPRLLLPYGVASIYSAGRQMAHMASHMQGDPLDPGYKPTRAATAMLSQILREWVPVDSTGGVAGMVTPTIASPFVDIEFNTSFTGKPLMPAASSFGRSVPDSARYFSTLDDTFSGMVAHKIADVLNLGGPEKLPTGLDVSPESVQRVLAEVMSYVGLGLTEFDRAGQFVTSKRPATVTWTPLLRDLVTEGTDYYVSERFYELRDKASMLRAAAAEGKEEAKIARERDPALWSMLDAFEQAHRRTGALRQRIKDADTRGERRELRDQLTRVQARVVRRYYGKLEAD